MTKSDEFTTQTCASTYENISIIYAILAVCEAIKELPAQIVEQIKNLDEDDYSPDNSPLPLVVSPPPPKDSKELGGGFGEEVGIAH
ncbi:MAG: hypothetical protein ABH822_01540 [Patescibacteria group bacterium]